MSFLKNQITQISLCTGKNVHPALFKIYKLSRFVLWNCNPTTMAKFPMICSALSLYLISAICKSSVFPCSRPSIECINKVITQHSVDLKFSTVKVKHQKLRHTAWLFRVSHLLSTDAPAFNRVRFIKPVGLYTLSLHCPFQQVFVVINPVK